MLNSLEVISVKKHENLKSTNTKKSLTQTFHLFFCIN